MLKFLYWTRILLLCVPMLALFTIVQAVTRWPQETGEEHLVLQREFRMAQERDREIQNDLYRSIESTRAEVRELQRRQALSENFQSRMEEKADIIMKLLGAACALLVVQFVIPLMKLGLRREISRMKDEGSET